MKIGVPKEIKAQECRVAATPKGVMELVRRGHQVLVQSGAGFGIGATDEDYERVGALVSSQDEVWDSEMVLKVKEPLPSEWKYLRPGLKVFAYLHLAAARPLAEEMLAKKVEGIAFETVSENGRLPLLAPMSRIAGRLAVQFGARGLEATQGGKGILLGGDWQSRVSPANVLVLGAGNVGSCAFEVAYGMGASVRVLDVNLSSVNRILHRTPIHDLANEKVTGDVLTESNLRNSLEKADLVICAALVPGDSAPKLLDNAMLSLLSKGSVVVDVSIDQGGCVEGIAPTSHASPFFETDGILFCAVPNFPGAVPKTSSFALESETLPWTLKIASGKVDENVSGGLNVKDGKVFHSGVAHALGLKG